MHFACFKLYILVKTPFQKSYNAPESVLKKFATFCSAYSVMSKFSVSEDIPCYFSIDMVRQGLFPQTICATHADSDWSTWSKRI